MARGAMDLRGRVVIVDAGATRTLRGIQGALAGIGAQSGVAARGISTTMTGVRDSARTMRAVRTVGGGHGAYVGLGATGGALAFLRNEYDYQKAMNRTKAVLNMTDEKAFKPHRDLVVDLTRRYPATSAEIAKGASEIAMAGMSMAQVNSVLEAAVQGALASGESIKTVGMGVTDVILGMGKSMDKDTFLTLNNIMAAAGTNYSQDYSMFLAGYGKAAPVARLVGMDVIQLAGFLGILADGLYKAEKGGTALRTSMLNAAAPTKAASAQLQKHGIVLSAFKEQSNTFQLGGERGGIALSDLLTDQLGIDAEALGLADMLTPILSEPDVFGDTVALKRRLVSSISDALGLHDPDNTKLIAESVNGFIESGFQQLDFERLLRHMASIGFDKDPVAMKEVFKNRFTGPMGILINQLREGGAYDSKMAALLDRIPEATKRFSGILMEGFPGAVMRLGGAFDALLREMGKEGGAIDTLTGLIGQSEDKETGQQASGLVWLLNELSTKWPTTMKLFTGSLLGLGLLAPVGFALAGLAAGFTVLVALGGGILKFSGALWMLRRALTGIRGSLAGAGLIGGGAAAAGAGLGTLLGAGAGGAAAGLTAKQAGKALGRMGSATASGRMIGGMSAAGAAAGAGAAGKAGWLGRAGKLAGRAFWPLGLGLLGYETWQGYQKDGWKGALLNPLTLGLYSGGSAEAGEHMNLPAIDVEQDAGLGTSGQQAVSEAQALSEQIRQAFTVDLHSVGQQMMSSLAAGITAGGAQAVAAANSVASQVRAAGQRVQLNTGPNMMPAR